MSAKFFCVKKLLILVGSSDIFNTFTLPEKSDLEQVIAGW
jgi:hypothetical protein